MIRPDKIYLQVDPEGESATDWFDGVTWSQDRINNSDVEYIRMGRSFSYVDITTKGCNGWLNLFFGEHCVAMVQNVWIANEMRKVIPKKKLNTANSTKSSTPDHKPNSEHQE
jgi:hypothetical protein